MRTKTELETKINELQKWLELNTDNPYRTTIEADLRTLENQLKSGDYEV